MLADENPFKVGQDGGSEPFHPSIHFQYQLGPVLRVPVVCWSRVWFRTFVWLRVCCAQGSCG